MKPLARSRGRTISLISLNAALYAFLGHLTNFGILAPVFGVVRFWPAVVVPGVFSLVAGPVVGACGAAIGIFVSDVLFHGDAILSLLVGVPSNFLCFFIMGYLTGKIKAKNLELKILDLLAGGVAFVLSIYFYSLMIPEISVSTLIPGLIIGAIVLAPFVYSVIKGKDSIMKTVISSSIGLMVGSIVIGFGVWGYSHFIRLPPNVMGGASGLPLSAITLLSLWTFFTEIPFLLILVPPLVRALARVIRVDQ
jgi:hypothetical protein